MDLIPLDASLVRGSHGVIPADSLDWPVLIAPDGAAEDEIEAVDIFEVIQKKLGLLVNCSRFFHKFVSLFLL